MVIPHPVICDPVTDLVNGACGPTLNTCDPGIPKPAGTQSWRCLGSCGGTDADCSITTPPIEDGGCGDPLNTCASGAYQSVAGPTWNCLGINGGIDDLGCTAVVPGTCRSGISTVPGDCISGTASGTTNPWTCRGIGGGADVECRIGACGTAANTCAVGRYENILGGTSWRCEGNIDLTTADEPVCVVAECGDTQGSCAVGNPSGNTNPWTCAGPNGGVEATCEVGLCGTADTDPDGCAQGRWEDIADPPSGIATWNCLGSVDASANDDTPCTDGVGVCGPTQGTCDQGLSSSTITPRWTCEGGNPDPLVTSDDAECYVGVCGDPTTPGNCTEGDPSGFENPYVCRGNYHDDTVTADDDNCFFGVCGTADNAADGCDTGTYQFVSGPTWRCMGSDTGSYTDEANCTPVPGLCDYSDAGKCIDGESSDSTGNTNPWTCAGTAGAADANCLLAACDIGGQGTCLTGTPTGTTNPWTCKGGDPDPLVTSDDDEDCTFGVCDYSGPGRCLQGTPSASGYTWTCEGSWRGSWGAHTDDDVDCVIAQCRDANDGGEDNSLKGCITGQWAHVDDPAPPHDVPTWDCLGNAPPAVPAVTDDDDLGCQGGGDVDGKCLFVDKDTTGRCEQGNNPSDTGNQWVCEGIHGGADAPCTQGLCGIVQDTCIAGTLDSNVPGNRWHCLGNHHIVAYENDDDRDCEDEVEPGKCAYDSVGSCSEGNQIGNTSPWVCEGNNPDSTADDVECVIGVCGTSDNCDAGQYVDGPGDTWECKGNHPTVGITADDVTCTPPDADDCDFGSIQIDRNSLTPPAACVPASCVPRPSASWIVTNTAKPLHQCLTSGSCAAAGGNWRVIADPNFSDFCENTSPTNSMWNGWNIDFTTTAPNGLLELDWNNEQGEWTYYCANTCDATAQTCTRNGAVWNERCEHLHAAAMANNTGLPYWDQALSQTPACEDDPNSDINNGSPGFCDGGLPGPITGSSTGNVWRCHGAGFPASSIDCGTCDPDHGYEGDWPNCTQIQGTGDSLPAALCLCARVVFGCSYIE